MELVTMHTHTNYTGHGHGTVAELVDAAAAAKLGAIAVTEHYPMSAAMDPDNVVSMASGSSCPITSSTSRPRPPRHPEMQVIPGCEIDWLGAQEDRDFSGARLLQLHPRARQRALSRRLGLRRSRLRRRAGTSPWASDSVWRRYFEVWCQAASCTRACPSTCMSAPRSREEVRLSSRASTPSRSTTRRPRRRAVERPHGGGEHLGRLTYACAELFPAPDASAHASAARACPCSIGTDCA